MVLLFLYQLYTQLGLLMYLLRNGHAWTFETITYFARPLFFLPLAAGLFIARKNIGWILLSGYLVYLTANTIILIVQTVGKEQPATDALNALSHPLSIDYLSGWLIFNTGCLYFIFKKDIREVYKINRKSIIAAVILGVALTLTAILA